MKTRLTLFAASLLFIACNKEPQMDRGVLGNWKWTVQYGNTPSDMETPQSTGIKEMLLLNNDNSWSVLHNGSAVNSGTYKTSLETNTHGEQVNTIHYSSQTGAKDSVCYYQAYDATLIFSNGFMDSSGSGARYYIKQ